MDAIGERYMADQTEFSDDLQDCWGDWGVDSEIGRLRSVLVRRPGAEIDGIDPAAVRFRAEMDGDKARYQHDVMCDVYRENGVTVHCIEEMAVDKANGLFVRDIVAGVPEGVILARPAMRVRRGEERYVARTLGQLGVPIIKTVSGTGTFEGADLMWWMKKQYYWELGIVLIGRGRGR